MKHLWTVIICAIAVSVFSPEALVQAQDTDPVQLSVDAGVSWTDNRDSAVDVNAADNTDVYVSPRLDLIARGDGGFLDFFYQPMYRYRENPNAIQNETEWLHQLALQGAYNVSRRLQVRLSERFDLTDDPSIQKEGTTLRRDSSFTLNQVEGSLGLFMTRASRIEFVGSHMVKAYDDAQRALESDEDKVGGSVRLWHQMTRTLSLSAVLDASSYGYDKSTAVIGGTSTIALNRDFDSMLAGAGFSKTFSPNLSAGLRAGFSSVEYGDSTLGTASSPFFMVNVDTSPSARTGVKMDYVFALRDSDVYPFASQENSNFNIDLTYAASSAITLGVSGTYRQGDYSRDSIPTGTTAADFAKGQEGTETTGIVNGYLGYSFDRDTTFKLVQQHENVDSDVSTSFSRNATKLVFSKHF